MATAISAIQSVLRLSTPELLVDGDWGPRTTNAFKSAGAVVRRAAESVATTFDLNLDALMRTKPEGIWITEAIALQYADRASKMAGLPIEWLRWMLRREPETKVENGVRYYRADSISPGGSYKGLFQIGKPGWMDARQERMFSHLGDFDRNWSNPELSAQAAAGLARRNQSYAKVIHGYKGPFNAQIIYAMHNQGHTFLRSARMGGMGKFVSGQSDSAKRDLKIAADLVRDSYSAQTDSMA